MFFRYLLDIERKYGASADVEDLIYLKLGKLGLYAQLTFMGNSRTEELMTVMMNEILPLLKQLKGTGYLKMTALVKVLHLIAAMNHRSKKSLLIPFIPLVKSCKNGNYERFEHDALNLEAYMLLIEEKYALAVPKFEKLYEKTLKITGSHGGDGYLQMLIQCCLRAGREKDAVRYFRRLKRCLAVRGRADDLKRCFVDLSVFELCTKLDREFGKLGLKMLKKCSHVKCTKVPCVFSFLLRHCFF